MTHNSFRETDCVDDDDEEYQTQLLCHSTRPTENHIWVYGNHEHDIFQSFSRTSSDQAFLHNLSGTDASVHHGAAFPLPPQQCSHFLQPGLLQPLSASYCCTGDRPNARPFRPYYNFSEPQMMISRGVDYNVARSIPCGTNYEIPPPTYSPGSVSPIATSPSLSIMSSPEQCYPYSTWLPSLPSSAQEDRMIGVSNDFDEDDGPFDKPYAQLIYAALMQAPGHRMLLRDIYEWFIQNTKKPRESGTNGWQNSIRHNLSMNQAFENDKNDPAASRGARKANSVWVLTEDAIKHGVQSTTRFRKNNSSKKSVANKTPAVKRQRSGARGGRAARRAARSKQTGVDVGKAELQPVRPRLNFALDAISHNLHENQDQWSNYDDHSPNTPQANQFLNLTYSLPHSSHYQIGDAGMKFEADPFLDEDDQLCKMLSRASSDDALEDDTNHR